MRLATKHAPSPLRNVPSARALRHLRYGLGLSQPDFAEEIGCSTQSLSAWENGKTRPGRMAERAIKHVAAEHGWGIDLDKGMAYDPVFRATAG